MPSVMNFKRVSGPAFSSNRTWYPTRPPSSQPSSSATRRETEAAASLLGWVQPTLPGLSPASSMAILGSWVVLPEPVSPTTTMT